MSDITVFTAITGGKDDLLDDQVKGDARFIAYLDYPFSSPTWEIRKAYTQFADPRRNSRIYKLLPHLYTDTEYSIWVDGNIRLLKSPEELVGKYLKEHDMAVFKHPTRDCIYDEAIVCAKRNLDNIETIIEQAQYYEDRGFAKNKGLAECNIIMRRHTPQVVAFNNEWWAQYSRFSRRDQISFPVAVDNTGIRVNSIPDYFIEDSDTHAVKRGGEFDIITHQHGK